MPSSPSLRQETEGLADSGLRCPACEYNLTGVAENRCPECGTAFDPERLKAILAGAPAPIPVWDDESQNVFIRFAKVCLLTWFQPGRLGRTFPSRYSVSSARRFRWAVVASTALVFCVTLVPLHGVRALVGIILGSIPVLTGIVLCDFMLLAALPLSEPEPPAVLPHPQASGSWTGLVGFLSSFLLLEAVIFSVMVLWGELGDVRNLGFMPEMLFNSAPFIVAGWWWWALAAVVAARPGSFGVKLAAIVLVPGAVALAAIGALLVGGVVFGCAGMILGF